MTTFIAQIDSIKELEGENKVWNLRLKLPKSEFGNWDAGDCIQIYPKNVITNELKSFCLNLGIKDLRHSLVIKSLSGNYLPPCTTYLELFMCFYDVRAYPVT